MNAAPTAPHSHPTTPSAPSPTAPSRPPHPRPGPRVFRLVDLEPGYAPEAPAARPLAPVFAPPSPAPEPMPTATALPGEADAVPAPALRSAHAVVRLALEVADGCRTSGLAARTFPPAVLEMLVRVARVGAPGRELGRASIRRVHVNPAQPGRPRRGPSAATLPDPVGRWREFEVCATYARGPRLFALAARIRVTETGADCTALRLV